MESEGLISQLGIDWKLLLSQAINFLILLLILRFFVYKPLLFVIKERNKKINQGLKKAEEAEIRLKEVDDIAKDKLKEVNLESISIIKNTEEKAKQLEKSLEHKAQKRQEELIVKIELEYKKQQEESKKLVLKEALELVKKTIIKTVQLDPKDIDQALIKKAILEVEKENI